MPARMGVVPLATPGAAGTASMSAQAEGDHTMTDVHPPFRLGPGGEEPEPQL